MNYKLKFFKKVLLNAKNIVKSFFIKSVDYQKQRLKICNSCEYNSKNKKELSEEDLFYIKMNGHADTCLACGCGIERKTKIAEEDCGLTEINQKPKWQRLEINQNK